MFTFKWKMLIALAILSLVGGSIFGVRAEFIDCGNGDLSGGYCRSWCSVQFQCDSGGYCQCESCYYAPTGDCQATGNGGSSGCGCTYWPNCGNMSSSNCPCAGMFMCGG